MKCMYCERKIPEDASFCPYCGQETESGQDVDELQERLLRQLSKEITGELPDTSWERRESREYVREYPVKSSKISWSDRDCRFDHGSFAGSYLDIIYYDGCE